MLIKITLIVLISCSFIMSASDFLAKRNYFRRVFTVSKMHQWVVSLLSLGIYVMLHPLNDTTTFILVLFTLFILVNNGRSLYKYLPFCRKKIGEGSKSDISIYALNVRQKNKDFQRTIKSVGNVSPDILVFTETNQEWCEALSDFDREYPFHQKVPLENTYGMLMYSKFEIRDAKIKYLINPEIPSIHANVMVQDREIHLKVIHPEPPISFRRLKEKDLEILLLSHHVEETNKATILCGDLNDVGWSYATRHMCEQTKLDDPRIGRGFYNTYNAHIPLFRYPIDHFFLSEEFRVTELKVLDKCGSDHFPVYIGLELSKEKG